MRKLAVAMAFILGYSAWATVVIDDNEPTDKNVVVAENEELSVQGNGLTANCTVSLGVGATVKFYKDATIAAPITSQGTVHFTTDTDAVTGTVAGAYMALCPSTGAKIWMDAPGLVSFIGGGVVTNGTGSLGTATVSEIWVNGNAQITNSTLWAYCALCFKHGHFTVANGGKMYHLGQHSAELKMDKSEQDGTSIFEVGKGGYVEYGNNNHLNLGFRTDYLSKLYINGGKIATTTPDRMILNKSGSGNTLVEIDNDGVLDANGRNFYVYNTSGKCKFLLKNGKWYRGARGYLFMTEYSKKAGAKLDVEVAGKFHFELSNFSTSLCDTPSHEYVAANWTCSPGGCLQLDGNSAKTSTFTIRGWNANGLHLDFPNSTYPAKLILEDPVQPVNFSIDYPLTANCGVSTTSATGGVASALKVGLECAYGATLYSNTLPPLFPTFSSVTLDHANFKSSASVWSFVDSDVAKDATAITNTTGNLILETDAGNVTELGGKVYYQDDSEKSYTLYNTDYWPGKTSSYSWTDHPNSWTTNKVAETEDCLLWRTGANCYLYLDHDDVSGDPGFVPTIYATKLFIKPSGYRVDGSWGRVETGHGGVEFVKSGKFSFCRNSNIDRILMGADQTWTNAAPSGMAYFMTSGVGASYWLARVSAKSSVKNWTLTGNLETWLTATNNNLGSVAIRVVSPAALRLVKLLDARLNARKLILEGAEMDFGKEFPTTDVQGTKHVSNVYIDQAHLGEEVELKDGGKLTIAAATAYDLPVLTATGAGNTLAGDGTLSINCAGMALAFTDAASELTINVPFANIEGKTLAATGAGTLTYQLSDAQLGMDVDLNGTANLKLTGAGRFAGEVANAASLTVAGSGIVNVAGAISSFGASSINVTAGTLLLENKDAIPAGVKINTSGEGAFMLVDATGFDPETMMEGTKNYQSPSSLIVTDLARENETIVVKNGETLQIYGSGLKESSKVILEDGSTIYFRNNATEYAPIVSTGAVNFVTLAGVTGTVAGFYTAETVEKPTSVKSISITSPGLLNLIGGGQLNFNNGGIHGTGTKPYLQFLLVSGNVQVTNCTYNTITECRYKSGHFTVKDGGTWWHGSQDNAHMSLITPTGDVCVEIGKGGIYRVYNNNYVYLGGSSTYEAKLYINGGTFRRDQADRFDLYNNCVLEIDNGGVFAISRQISVYANEIKGKILLKNGSWTGNGRNNNRFNLIDNANASYTAPDLQVKIDGEFTFDLSSFGAGSITNTVPGCSTWTATPSSRINLIGYSAARKLVMNSFTANGAAVSLNKDSNVTFLLNNAASPVELGYVLPGVSGNKIATLGTTPDLNLSYVVPSGATYEAPTTPGTFEGFNSVTVSNLVFDAGSALSFPVFALPAPTAMALEGAITLPAAMNYSVTPAASHRSVNAQPILAPALGFEGEPCTWTCTGNLARRDACEVATGDAGLTFSYTAPGLTIFIK